MTRFVRILISRVLALIRQSKSSVSLIVRILISAASAVAMLGTTVWESDIKIVELKEIANALREMLPFFERYGPGAVAVVGFLAVLALIGVLMTFIWDLRGADDEPASPERLTDDQGEVVDESGKLTTMLADKLKKLDYSLPVESDNSNSPRLWRVSKFSMTYKDGSKIEIEEREYR